MGSGRADLVAQPRGRRFAGVLKGVGSWGFEGFRLFVGFGFKGSGFADLGSPKTLNPHSPRTLWTGRRPSRRSIPASSSMQARECGLREPVSFYTLHAQETDSRIL